MESVKNGALMRLPIGFKFEPTNEELILHYLRNKVMSHPLPSLIIPEFEICKSDPWDLPGDSEKEKYFFSVNEAIYPNGDIPSLSFGYWKATGIDRQIVASEGNEVILGMMKIFVYYRGMFPNGFETDWFMHQYRMPASATADGSAVNPKKKIKLSKNSGNAAAAMDKNWVLSKIFRRKEAKMRFFFDLNVDPSSSDSSEITVESPPTHEPDHQEESSCSNKP
ncbi:NAC domain-containing protein 83-like [Impatiens glandulifera]|uniref:NAC domain-containing protein 83-like n=1 Tax=Impatiens glandulifera TaxID=253017 RepID=UPI001FB0B679|nr:NAC domain-containing protein 83-like [Impatiens glandulifera]